MFWDKAAGYYDLFENVYNGKVNKALASKVAELVNYGDEVLECACGTGMLTRAIAPKCKSVIATDFSEGMLKKAKKKCKADNVIFDNGNIMELPFGDNGFDVVIAGNVIHLLDNPEDAIKELLRVCKPNGRVIVPTYVNNENKGQHKGFIKLLEKSGADFKCQFDYKTYQEFFYEAGYKDAEFILVEGKMPCAIAVIKKEPATIRKMTVADYDQVYKLWMSVPGMGLNNVDDSKEGIEKFLKKNPNTCFVATNGNEIVGVIMIGNDGRRGYIYHTAVHPEHRRKKIAQKLVEAGVAGLREEGITKVALVAFARNEMGNDFWEAMGFELRDDLTYRDKALTILKRIDT